MATCLLVYVPGLPLRIEHLLPQEELAAAAGEIRRAGHAVQILDFGAVFSHALPPVSPLVRRGWGLGPRRDDPTARHAAALASRIAMVCSERGGVDLVAFLVHEREGLAMSTLVNRELLERAEDLRTICFGGYAERFAPHIAAFNPAFNAVVAEEPGASLARALRAPDLGFAGTPGLVIREPEGAMFTGRAPKPERNAGRALPDYSAATYPQLHTGEKLLYFPVRHTADPRAAAPISVMARVRNIRDHFHATALHFDCGPATADQLAALGRGLSAMPGACSIAASVPAISGLAPEVLATMRCAGVHLKIPSGSQRLLDDFFGAGFTITQVEQACRVARAAGAALETAYSYPCPWDDHHTAAETLRVVSRTRPEGVTMRAPELAPGTPWYADPTRYGFRLEHRRLARYAACATSSIRRSGLDAFNEGEAQKLGVSIGALGIETGLDVHELTCARLLGADEEIGAHAAALRNTIARGSHTDARTVLNALNGAIAAATARARTGGIRAAIGN